MTRRKNIIMNWDVADNGDAKGRDMSAGKEDDYS